MKTDTLEKLPQAATVTAPQRKGNAPHAVDAALISRVRDPREMERAELETYLQSTESFPTKASLLEFARRYNVPVNARTQREEIIRLCLRMIHDIPASFAELRATERAPSAPRAPGAETRKVLENFFVSSKSEERTNGQDGKKIATTLLEDILHCHEAGLLLTQVRGADIDMFRHALETCETPIDTHVRFLSNLVDFARLEAGKYESARAPLRLSDCVGGALKRLAFSAHQRGLELCYAIHADTPEYVVGDAARLQQVLINLVDNAIKFTTSGEVVVDVKSQKSKVKNQSGDHTALDSRPETCDLLFSVRDTGVGMSGDQLRAVKLLFASEQRGDKPPLGGLGLLISHRLVQLMGGQMEVVSEGEGELTFSFSVRLYADKSHNGESRAKLTALRGRRILVVDDNATHRRIVHDLLQSWGAQATLASSGREALALLYKQPDDDPFAAIVIDGHLSDIEGFASIRRQHIADDPARVSPVIMMLASIDPARDMTRYRELHVTAFLQKPITPAELFQALLEALVSGSMSPDEEVFDRTALWSLVAGDTALLRELIGLFDQDCPRLFFTMQQAVMVRNCRDVVTAAHALKGAISNFAARGVARVLAVIESFGGQGDFKLVQETMTQLAVELARLKLALDELRQELSASSGEQKA
jgi:signal transduction histidine kinase/FixJ family two-component response regulator